MEKMQELFKKVSKDVTLQEKFSVIIKDAEKAGEDVTKKKLAAFAKAEGYDIKLEEMQAFFNELADKDKGELSDVELDMVAGGKGVVGGEMIAISVVSIGIGCAVFSAAVEVNVGTGRCGQLFNA
jgi:hypothetical protein